MAVSCFLKFGRKEHLESFCDGNIHFSPATCLRSREKELQKGVGDSLEGGIEIANNVFQIANYTTGQTIVAPLKLLLNFEPNESLPIFCVTACSDSECKIQDDGRLAIFIKPDRLKWFQTHFDGYDTVAVVKQPDRFIKDMELAFAPNLRHEAIKYRDKEVKKEGDNPLNILMEIATKGKDIEPCHTYSASVSDSYDILFIKDTFFSLEQEYRFVITNDALRITQSTDMHIIQNSSISLLSIDELLSTGSMIC